MSLPSVFQILQLALGPSLPYTNGAFKTGQYFREVLLSVPHATSNRIIIEFLGNFASAAKLNQSDKALIAGLGGYIPGETRMGIMKYHSIIQKEGAIQLMGKAWPFHESSDAVFSHAKKDLPHPNTIRFHVIDENEKILLQAEYIVSSNGVVNGPGSRDSDAVSSIGQVVTFEEIFKICNEENLDLINYIHSAESTIRKMSLEKMEERMVHTWEIMDASIENGISNKGLIHESVIRQAHILLSGYKEIISSSEILSKENAQASIYATGVCEESLSNQLVITAPVCETAGILASVLKTVQQKFRFSKNQMAKSLLVGGFTGAILQKHSQPLLEKHDLRLDFQIATAMAAAAGMYLIQNDLKLISLAINNALRLSGKLVDHSSSQLIRNNVKHSNLAITAINLSLIGFDSGQQSVNTFFTHS